MLAVQGEESAGRGEGVEQGHEAGVEKELEDLRKVAQAGAVRLSWAS